MAQQARGLFERHFESFRSCVIQILGFFLDGLFANEEFVFKTANMSIRFISKKISGHIIYDQSQEITLDPGKR